MPQSWIQPQQNSFLDTFAQAEQIKNARSANALAEAQVAELPYERERAEALNTANIAKAQAQAGKAAVDTEGAQLANTLKKLELGTRILSQARDEGSYQWAKKYAVAQGLPIDDLPENFDPAFVEHRLQSGMAIKDKLAAQLAERRFTEQQKQSGIDNDFQQGNLDVARGGLAQRIAHDTWMQNKPESGGFSITTNPDGTVSVNQGKALTEGQSKATTNVTGATVANTELSDLKEGGFDPTSAGGGMNTWMASKPGLNWVASEEGQRQHAANTGFAQAVNYQRSGAATPEIEYLRAVDSMMDRYGDKPAATQYKARMRNAMIQAVTAGGGPQVDQIVRQVLAANAPAGGAQPPPNAAAGSVSNRTRTAAPPPGGGAPQGAAPQRATNPKTGEVLELQGGQWRPVQ